MKVVNLSSLINIKGIEYFMLSYDFLRNKKSIFYQIHGEGSLRKELEPLQNTNIRLMGFTSNPEKIIIKSDVLVVTSVIPESFSLVAVEAFKYGKPVITTSIGGQAEIVVDHEVGLHCFPKNPQSLAEKIDLLYEDKELYDRLSSNALEHSKKFKYEIFNEKILQVFDSVSV